MFGNDSAEIVLLLEIVETLLLAVRLWFSR